MNVEDPSERVNKAGDTDNTFFFTTRVSQVIVNIMKRVSEQWSDL